ncbi:formin-like protein 20 [Penaeus monodon]|uniref:formin-like protein 20 n=1 Tax=Penaeus monodon TaxID=6687 RepID=UPI0018A72920|nr:formin-like protein 20 [Penaeus monodon]
MISDRAKRDSPDARDKARPLNKTASCGSLSLREVFVLAAALAAVASLPQPSHDPGIKDLFSFGKGKGGGQEYHPAPRPSYGPPPPRPAYGPPPPKGNYGPPPKAPFPSKGKGQGKGQGKGSHGPPPRPIAPPKGHYGPPPPAPPKGNYGPPPAPPKGHYGPPPAPPKGNYGPPPPPPKGNYGPPARLRLPQARRHHRSFSAFG